MIAQNVAIFNRIKDSVRCVNSPSFVVVRLEAGSAAASLLARALEPRTIAAYAFEETVRIAQMIWESLSPGFVLSFIAFETARVSNLPW